MKIKDMIPPKYRQHMHCHFCGTNKSVKYLVEVSENNKDLVPACNKCAAIMG